MVGAAAAAAVPVAEMGDMPGIAAAIAAVAVNEGVGLVN